MQENNSYIFGRNAVLEAIKSGNSVEKIFILFGTKGDNISRIYGAAKRNKIACVTYDKSKFINLEKSVCPKNAKAQGVIALIRPFDTVSLAELTSIAIEKEKHPVIIALDGITDPQNFGAIARSAECSGAAGILISERNSAPVTPSALKASAGALEHIPLCRVSSLIQAFTVLKDNGFWVIGTEMDADKNYTEENYDSPVVIVIGSEGKGISPSVAKHCDIMVKIPLKGKINSLNASVSAGIILFEILRKKTL